jgi:hypothetical protein
LTIRPGKVDEKEKRKMGNNPVIEMLFKDVAWEPTGLTEPEDDGIPVATHRGTLNLFDAHFRVYQLSDGRRIFDAEDVNAFFGMTTEAR